jgi:hypothetical protein
VAASRAQPNITQQGIIQRNIEPAPNRLKGGGPTMPCDLG